MPATRYHNRERAAQLATFLKALSLGKTKKAAAEEAGLCLRGLYRLRRADEIFAARWQAAIAACADLPADPLELEAQRRAVSGTEKPVYRGGTLVGHTTDYSDSMLMFLLKAKYPEKYDRTRSKAQKPEGGPDGANEKACGISGEIAGEIAGKIAGEIAGARDALLGKFLKATD